MNFKKVSVFLNLHKEILLVALLYFITRLINLKALPIFNDEAIYLDWGWREISQPGNLYYSLYDGKQPLLMWIFGIFEKIIPDPLVAGRLVSVIAGGVTLLGIYFLAKKLFDKKVAIIAMLLFVLNPLFFFFDRQALMESAVCAIGVWAFYFLLEFTHSNLRKHAILLGLVLGVGLFIKSTTFIFAITSFVLLAYCYFKTKNKSEFIKNCGMIFLLIFCIDFLLIINPQFWSTLSMNQRYTFSISEILKFPASNWLNNILLNIKILIIYFNPLILISSFAGIFLLIKRKSPDYALLIVWLIISLFLEIILTKESSQRYLVSFLPLLIIPAAFSVSFLLKKSPVWGKLFLTSTVLISSVYIFFQIFNPYLYIKNTHNFSGDHSIEYISGYTSGYGIPEVVRYLKNQLKDKPIYIGMALNTGNPESAMQVYFAKDNMAKTAYLDESLLGTQMDLIKYSDCLRLDRDAYLVSRDNSLAGFEKFFEKVKEFKKPEGKETIGIYRLKKNCKGKYFKLFPQKDD